MIKSLIRFQQIEIKYLVFILVLVLILKLEHTDIILKAILPLVVELLDYIITS